MLATVTEGTNALMIVKQLSYIYIYETTHRAYESFLLNIIITEDDLLLSRRQSRRVLICLVHLEVRVNAHLTV